MTHYACLQYMRVSISRKNKSEVSGDAYEVNRVGQKPQARRSGRDTHVKLHLACHVFMTFALRFLTNLLILLATASPIDSWETYRLVLYSLLEWPLTFISCFYVVIACHIFFVWVGMDVSIAEGREGLGEEIIFVILLGTG